MRVFMVHAQSFMPNGTTKAGRFFVRSENAFTPADIELLEIELAEKHDAGEVLILNVSELAEEK